MEHFTIPVIDTLCCKLRRNSSSAISVPDIVVEDYTDDLCFTRYDLQIMHITPPGVDPPRFDKPITIRWSSSTVEALTGKLLHPGLGPFGDFQTFTGILPIANVIDQLVGMALKSLRSLSGTPNLNSQHGEILYKKRNLRIPSS